MPQKCLKQAEAKKDQISHLLQSFIAELCIVIERILNNERCHSKVTF